jgi:hypothetical protein
VGHDVGGVLLAGMEGVYFLDTGFRLLILEEGF